MAISKRAVFGIALCASFLAAVRADAQLITLDQGSTRSLTSTSASITTMNGAPGFISATTLRPFVFGLIPVVGDYGGAAAPIYGPAALIPQYNPGPSVVQERIARMRQEGISFTPSRSAARSPMPKSSVADRNQDSFQSRLTSAQQSSAGHSAQSIAAIRRRQQQQDEDRERSVDELYHRMRQAQAAGKPEVARVYQQQFERESKNSSSPASPRPAAR
jgi:hypothetical protein